MLHPRSFLHTTERSSVLRPGSKATLLGFSLLVSSRASSLLTTSAFHKVFLLSFPPLLHFRLSFSLPGSVSFLGKAHRVGVGGRREEEPLLVEEERSSGPRDRRLLHRPDFFRLSSFSSPSFSESSPPPTRASASIMTLFFLLFPF